MPHYTTLGKVFGQEVSRVGFPLDLKECKGAVTQLLLSPQLGDRQVADSPDPGPPANADRRGGVGEQPQGNLDGEVQRQGLQSQPLRRALDHAAAKPVGIDVDDQGRLWYVDNVNRFVGYLEIGE